MAVITHHDQKASWGNLFSMQFIIRVDFGLQFIVIEGGQGRNLNVETEAEAVEECSCSWLVQFAFLSTLGSPAQGWPLPPWAEASHSNHLSRKQAPHPSSVLANLRKENSTSVEVSSFQMTLACVKLTETNKRQLTSTNIKYQKNRVFEIHSL